MVNTISFKMKVRDVVGVLRRITGEINRLPGINITEIHSLKAKDEYMGEKYAHLCIIIEVNEKTSEITEFLKKRLKNLYDVFEIS